MFILQHHNKNIENLYVFLAFVVNLPRCYNFTWGIKVLNTTRMEGLPIIGCLMMLSLVEFALPQESSLE